MSKTSPVTKDAAAPVQKDSIQELPGDRPATGIHTRDDGRRTEHGVSPLDPMYLGTKIADSDGHAEAMKAREEAGLQDAPVNQAAETKDEDPAA